MIHALTGTAEPASVSLLNGRRSQSPAIERQRSRTQSPAVGAVHDGNLPSIARAMRAVDAERQRIGRELHDGVAQVITATIFLLDRCLLDEPNLPDPVRTTLERARGLLDETTVDLYRLVNDLRPRVVDDLGLVEAIRSYSRRWSQDTGIEVTCELDPTIQLGAEAEASMFRIVQEALANVRKHAGASQVAIILRTTDEHIVLTIHDNGRGLRSSKQRSAGGLGGNGLSAMCERARLMGGELEIFSIPGIGTDLTVRVPYAHLETSDGHPFNSHDMQMEDAPCLVSG